MKQHEGASGEMRSPEPKPLRVRSVSTKLTEAEYAKCGRMAAQCGLAVSEWCRQAVLEASTIPAAMPESEVILGELLALRKIVINLIYRHDSGEQLTEEFVQELIESADAHKISKAMERLQAVLQAGLGKGGPNDGEHINCVADTRGDGSQAKGLAE
jgi:hypothetical protein